MMSFQLKSRNSAVQTQNTNFLITPFKWIDIWPYQSNKYLYTSNDGMLIVGECYKTSNLLYNLTKVAICFLKGNLNKEKTKFF